MKTLYDLGVANEVEDRVSQLKPDSLRQFGKMNSPQMVAALLPGHGTCSRR